MGQNIGFQFISEDNNSWQKSLWLREHITFDAEEKNSKIIMECSSSNNTFTKYNLKMRYKKVAFIERQLFFA